MSLAGQWVWRTRCLHLLGSGQGALEAGWAGSAEGRLRAALAIVEEEEPDGTLHAAVLIPLAMALEAQLEPGEARGLLERALALLERIEGPHLARCLYRLGMNALALDRPDEACALLERSHQRMLAARGADHRDVAEVLEELASVDLRGGRPGQARARLEQALAIYRLHPGSENLAEAEALRGLALVARLDGDAQEAAARERAAEAILDAVLERGGDASLDALLRWLEARAGRPFAWPAGELADRAVAVAERVHGPMHRAVAERLQKAGWVHLERRLDARAEACFRRALDLRDALPGDRVVDVQDCLNGLGLTLYYRGRTEQAVECFERLLALAESLPRGGGARLAVHLNNLAKARHQAGELEAAESLLDRAQAIASVALDPEHEEERRAPLGRTEVSEAREHQLAGGIEHVRGHAKAAPRPSGRGGGAARSRAPPANVSLTLLPLRRPRLPRREAATS